MEVVTDEGQIPESVSQMAKQRIILSPEELAARRARKEAGLPPTNERDTLVLKTKVAELQEKLERQELAAATKGPTTQSLRKDLDKLFSHYDIEPAEELIKIATEKNENGSFKLTSIERAQIWENLMQYRMPKLRATEKSGKVEHNLTIKVVTFSVKPEEERVLSEKTIDISNAKP